MVSLELYPYYHTIKANVLLGAQSYQTNNQPCYNKQHPLSLQCSTVTLPFDLVVAIAELLNLADVINCDQL